MFHLFGDHVSCTAEYMRFTMHGYIKDNKEVIQRIVGPFLARKKLTLDEYSDYIKEAGNPGDEVALYLLSVMTDRPTCVIGTSSCWWTQKGDPDPEKAAIVFAYLGGTKFVDTIPKAPTFGRQLRSGIFNPERVPPPDDGASGSAQPAQPDNAPPDNAPPDNAPPDNAPPNNAPPDKATPKGMSRNLHFVERPEICQLTVNLVVRPEICQLTVNLIVRPEIFTNIVLYVQKS